MLSGVTFLNVQEFSAYRANDMSSNLSGHWALAEANCDGFCSSIRDLAKKACVPSFDLVPQGSPLAICEIKRRACKNIRANLYFGNCTLGYRLRKAETRGTTCWNRERVGEGGFITTGIRRNATPWRHRRHRSPGCQICPSLALS